MPGAGLQPEFVPHYQMLLSHGVSRKRAAALVQNAASRGDLRAFRNPRVFLERLKMEVRRDISVTGGIALEAGRRKVVALVGATGVGKTTNLAKLGALYSVQEHARVGVITTDTYRVAATDQLEVYAGIIDVTMHIVHDVAGMRSALKAFADRDLVLIDTAGGSPFNRAQMTEMRELIDAAHPDEVHLLVSANTALEDARDVVTHFSIMKPTSLFFTKLDETRRYGPLYCLAAEAGLPLSYLSVGQNVPDDIMPAGPGTIAKLVVDGGDELGGTSTKSA
jgi:flagellar biosynthesis protein FlhF